MADVVELAVDALCDAAGVDAVVAAMGTAQRRALDAGRTSEHDIGVVGFLLPFRSLGQGTASRR
jgi:hypothetical protein